jgi:hypothetical protein
LIKTPPREVWSHLRPNTGLFYNHTAVGGARSAIRRPKSKSGGIRLPIA